MTLAKDVQKSYAGQLVTLYELDCTDFADTPILYFTNTSSAGGPLLWNGNVYSPIEIKAEGFEWNGQSAFPTPTLKLSNVTDVASSLVIAYSDLIGATLRRIRTFRQYLDDGDTPDPLQIFPVDVYKVEQKTRHSRTLIEWKLSAAIDQQGVNIPSFQLVRDYCNRVYRRYDPIKDEIVYDKSTCPYTGPMYDIDNNPTSDPTKDACPKTLIGCEVRFGESTPLPFKGCPGLARFR